MPQEKIRLQKYLSECGVAARRKAEKLIEGGQVSVNGKIIREQGVRINPALDQVQVQGRTLKPPPRGMVLLNKPRGVVCTVSDPEGRRTVIDYLGPQQRSYFPVGRLDVDSSGLVILTNDGELAQRLLHPKYGAKRVYVCSVRGEVERAALARVARGVRLRDGVVRAECALLKREAGNTLLEVVIKEGRNRVIRRLMEEIGHPVIFLKRVSHGPLRLGGLKSGEIKRLSEREYGALRRKILEQAERSPE